MIEHNALLASLRPVVSELEADIRQRVLDNPSLSEHLGREHSKALAAHRTAMSVEEWSDGEITQAAVAWVLACVFVRFLEDNGLIDRPLISGPGDRRVAALGRREEHFRAHPEHTDREYLEDCFRTIAAFPAVGPLYDERHNPLWRLGPSADGARMLRETFTAIDPDTGELAHDFTDSELDSRFLGDLYQDLSETARKRYALLQTPEFVARFILDRTLEPAIDEFGLETVRLIDPTCGSGHFLIDAFERLFAKRQEREPGTPTTVLAQRALDAVYGVDLNPYATAIARFRLVTAALRACGVNRLAEAPAFRLNLATGDSLLHGPLPSEGASMLFDANRLRKNIAHVFEAEDTDELRRILGQGYHAVVGNPPYIAVSDAALRDAYRARYASCHGHYVMAVPFMERFFELARIDDEGGQTTAGFVGKITANSFMRRDFGKHLIEHFLKDQDLTAVIDSSGADIPGHEGLPTVILFARARPPVESTVPILRASRAESDNSVVDFWTAASDLLTGTSPDAPDLIREDRARVSLDKWPWTLDGGDAALAEVITRASVRKLADILDDVGRTTHTGEDSAFFRTFGRVGTAVLVRGDDVRDWNVDTRVGVVLPYDGNGKPIPLAQGRTLHEFWPLRTVLRNRRDFGQTPEERGLLWHEHSMFFPRRLLAKRALVTAFMSHVNQFAPMPGEAVSNRSAPLLVVSETDLSELLGVLNSSTATFVIHSRCQPKPGYTELWSARYEINHSDLKSLPLPRSVGGQIGASMLKVSSERQRLLDEILGVDARPLRDALLDASQQDFELRATMISLQEELDWQVLAAYGLVSGDIPVPGLDAPPIAVGQRAFEIVLARRVASGETETAWFERHGANPITHPPGDWPAAYRRTVEQRIALIEDDSNIGLVERPEHKRRWSSRPWVERQQEGLVVFVLSALERPDLWSASRLRSTAELTDYLRAQPRMVEALELLGDGEDADVATTLRRLVLDASVPHIAALRLAEKGLRKRDAWEKVWEAQREEARIAARAALPVDDAEYLTLPEADALKVEQVGTIPVPPRYAQADFRSPTFWKLRGKLDVPKERFTLIPGAERGADASPVIGWAGWGEADLARALAGRITELREQEATDAERLVPLLAGVLELLPWIQQWHPDSDPLYGGPPGRYFENWLDGQLAELGVTRENLRSWRPPAATRGRRAKVTVS
jgi:hypothetical protein